MTKTGLHISKEYPHFGKIATQTSCYICHLPRAMYTALQRQPLKSAHGLPSATVAARARRLAAALETALNTLLSKSAFGLLSAKVSSRLDARTPCYTTVARFTICTSMSACFYIKDTSSLALSTFYFSHSCSILI